MFGPLHLISPLVWQVPAGLALLALTALALSYWRGGGKAGGRKR